MRTILAWLTTLVLISPAAPAGPPFVSDDPEPTDYQHYEIYSFSSGTSMAGGTGGQAGIDFNYGATPDLQLTSVVPIAHRFPDPTVHATGLGNIELAAKYRFLHQADAGWDVALFPRVFLPSLSNRVGDQHAAFFLPLWAERDWGEWSAFGGGGCEINRGQGSQDFCLAGWALTRQVGSALRLGGEFFYQTADTKGGKQTAGIDVGALWDVGEHYHLLASFGPGVQNAGETDRYSWYAALLLTF